MPNTILQEGIYYNYKDTGKSIGRFLTIMLLKVKPCATAYQVGQTLQKLWDIYQDLKNNKIRDFEQPIPNLDEKEACQCPADLTVLVGYGPKCFKVPGVRKCEPDALETFSPPTTNSSPTTESEYQSILAGSGLVYAKDVDTNPAETEIVLQFIGNTQLTVYRPVVETWKYLHDMQHDQSINYPAPLAIETFYSGFRREDRRSWIDFHDGVSNLTPDTRRQAIENTGDDGPVDPWTYGSTYLAFLRIEMDLAAWRSLLQFDTTGRPSNWEKQELAVGRSKLTGCALDDGQNGLGPLSECLPDSAEHVFSEGANRVIPPVGRDSPLSHSHVQRANHQGSSNKIFRQGFEFLESTQEPPGFRAGLNFISFQKQPLYLINVLSKQGWLIGHNFGGDPTDSEFDALKHFLTVRAAGFYLVPPRADAENKTLPGLADLFPAQETEHAT